MEPNSSTEWARRFGLAAAVVLGALHAYTAAANFSMNEDGISYLDIGDAYFRGDWDAALSTMWSPMYSWVLGLVMKLVGPNMRWEIPLVHLVNFVIYLGALAGFTYFWKQLDAYSKSRTKESEELVSLPDWAWTALGYLLFIISSLQWIEIWAVTPDMLMAILVYWAAAILVKLRIERGSLKTYLGLGVVLGLGYLAKTIMLPVTLLVLIVLFLDRQIAGRDRFKPIATLVAFVLVISPFVAAVSLSTGELSLGSAGSFTYAKHVNGVVFSHWQGEDPANGTPLHPTRKIFEAPAIYEFATPISGTYPVNYDPGYWYAGLQVNFNLQDQVQAVLKNASFYMDVLVRQLGGLLFGVLCLMALEFKKPRGVAEFFSRFGLLFIAAGVMGFYGIIYAEGRYVAAFVVLLSADLLADVRLPVSQARVGKIVSTLMVLFLAVTIVFYNVDGLVGLSGGPSSERAAAQQAGRSPRSPLEAAELLQEAGVTPGMKIGVIGDAFTSFWARLARVQIVAEMFGAEAHGFFDGEPALQSDVLHAFDGAGVDVIVAENVPANARLDGWQQVGDTHYFLYLIKR